MGESYDDLDNGSFNDLEKHFYPCDHVEIDRFHEDSYTSIDEIFEIGNDRQIANNVIDLIVKGDNSPDDYAIVLNPRSAIADAVRSALYRNKIPFRNSLDVRDLISVREFLEFVSLSFQYDVLHVRDVRELITGFNGGIPDKTDNYLFSKIDGSKLIGRANGLRNLMSSITEKTFKEVSEYLFEGDSRSSLTTILKETGFYQDIITEKRFLELRYLVDNVNELKHNEQQPENETGGVILIDCMNSGCIDKPIVFYLGMGQDWNLDVVSRRYIDADLESKKEVLRFSLMLQQGSVRGYFVNSTKDGVPARPSLTFDYICDKAMESFNDVCSGDLRKGRWHVDTDSSRIPEIFKREDERAEGQFKFDFSKSSFNNYCECPRKFLFGRLLKTEDNDKTWLGNILHEYAEAYATHRDEVLARSEEVDEHIYSRYSGLSTPASIQLDKDKLKLEMANIRAFIDSLNLKLVNDRPLDGSNELLSWLGIDVSSSSCEKDASSKENHIIGRFDLCSESEIVDFKSGRMPDECKIGSKMCLFCKKDYYEFQPLMYLALGAESNPPINSFRLFYAYANDEKSLDGGSEVLERNCITVQRVSCSFEEAVCKAIKKSLCDNGHSGFATDDFAMSFYNKVLNKINTKLGILSGLLDVEQYWNKKEELRYVKFAKDLVDKKFSDRSDYEDVASFIKDRLFNAVKESIRCGIPVGISDVYITDDVYSQFLADLRIRYDLVLRCSDADFPSGSDCDCSKCDFQSVCMNTLIDQDMGGDFDE